MKTFTFFSASLLAALAAASPAAPPVPEPSTPANGALANILAAAREPIPPAHDQRYRCDTSSGSPGSANVALAAEWFRTRDRNMICATGGGGHTQMYEADGVRIYASGPSGSTQCNRISGLLTELIGGCSQINAGDIRVGGTIWMNSPSDGTFVFVTQR
ncbi:hypothetical protein QBC34DRAFT_382627 [Podospora aff. communis PSN243]|uniref:Ecp2 effector protein domain-containing protein n=1 Tax=Podospora aff. communis PSN243 TaxID=3040156 RepID=A0AAV9GG48_9PEZI|nr:hypothetical protein QBC34DRAFT_382627 [Podospora aff. communis PSN243]